MPTIVTIAEQEISEYAIHPTDGAEPVGTSQQQEPPAEVNEIVDYNHQGWDPTAEIHCAVATVRIE
ncbi:hypothetical protein G9463_21200 [Haloarcula sp. JP-Z28]|uniref:hypothetical protein n=1 Tax=Haloarcula sp. JP-Z28 TaxID=2716715 RepID=UPI0014047397|nr:hypothetical protein [Haloarcula sp. JP-Z28]NHN65761.1 hypothetical protein [Haloarcula sp. JP-Z28]